MKLKPFQLCSFILIVLLWQESKEAFIEIPKDMAGLIGSQDINLTCKSDSQELKWVVIYPWDIFQTQIFPPTNPPNNNFTWNDDGSILYIKKLDKDHANPYFCLEINSNHYSLARVVAFNPINGPSDFEGLTEGQELNITCEVTYFFNSAKCRLLPILSILDHNQKVLEEKVAEENNFIRVTHVININQELDDKQFSCKVHFGSSEPVVGALQQRPGFNVQKHKEELHDLRNPDKTPTIKPSLRKQNNSYKTRIFNKGSSRVNLQPNPNDPNNFVNNMHNNQYNPFNNNQNQQYFSNNQQQKNFNNQQTLRQSSMDSECPNNPPPTYSEQKFFTLYVLHSVSEINFNISNPSDVNEFFIGDSINCLTNGRPRPRINWYNSEGKIVSTDENLIIEEHMATGKPTPYTCVASIDQSAFNRTLIIIVKDRFGAVEKSGTPAWVIAISIVIPLLFIISLLLLLLLCCLKRKKSGPKIKKAPKKKKSSNSKNSKQPYSSAPTSDLTYLPKKPTSPENPNQPRPMYLNNIVTNKNGYQHNQPPNAYNNTQVPDRYTNFSEFNQDGNTSIGHGALGMPALTGSKQDLVGSRGDVGQPPYQVQKSQKSSQKQPPRKVGKVLTPPPTENFKRESNTSSTNTTASLSRQQSGDQQKGRFSPPSQQPSFIPRTKTPPRRPPSVTSTSTNRSEFSERNTERPRKKNSSPQKGSGRGPPTKKKPSNQQRSHRNIQEEDSEGSEV